MRDQQPVARSAMVPFLGTVALALFALNFFAFLHKHFHQVRHIICQHDIEAVAERQAFTVEADGLNLLMNRSIEHDLRMADHAVRKAQRMIEHDRHRAEREMARAERELRQALREMERIERRREPWRFKLRSHDRECAHPSHDHERKHRHRTIVVRPHEARDVQTLEIRVQR